MLKNKIYIIIVVILVGISGMFLWNQFSSNAFNQPTVVNSIPSESVLRPSAITVAKRTYTIQGKVKSLAPSSLVFEDPNGKIRTAYIFAETKFVRVIPVPPEVHAREEEIFRKSLNNPNSSSQAQMKMTMPQETQITFSDIKIGDNIIVIAEEDIDVVQRIKAIEVRVI